MLEWKEIIGYNPQKDYRRQDGVELPELGEEILIQNPGKTPFVGYFSEDKITGHVWTVAQVADGMMFIEVQDGIKWARFNRA